MGLSGRKHAGLRSRLRHLGMLAAGVLIPMLLLVVSAVQSYRSGIEDAKSLIARRANVQAEHVGRVLDFADSTMDLVEQRVAGMTPARIATSREIHDFLRTQVKNPALVQSVSIVDDAGQVIASSNFFPVPPRNVADRAYFRDARIDALTFSEQLDAKLTGDRIFLVVRRRAEGGVLAVGLHTRYFTDFFATTAGHHRVAVSIYREDGVQLARYPALDQPVNLGPDSPFRRSLAHSPEEGVHQGRAVVDGKERLFAYKRVSGHPIYANFGLDMAAVIEPWIRDVALHALLACVSAVVLVSMILSSVRRERVQAEAQAMLESQVAQRTADLVRAKLEAEQANRAKSHFLAAASHDLRQPIQGLRLFLDVLEQRLPWGEDAKVVALAGKALEGAEHLLSTLLDVSALEAGMVATNPQPVALDDVLSALVVEFTPQTEARGLRLRHVPTSLWVRTDPVLLARLLRNLITNALRYTPSGAILLGCRRHGRQVRVEVWDSGIGIPADKIEAVFEDFVQLGNPERDRAKGLGLGLPVARRMATLLGHRLEVRSRVGRGTVFWLTLPMVKEPKVRDTAAAPACLPA